MCVVIRTGCIDYWGATKSALNDYNDNNNILNLRSAENINGNEWISTIIQLEGIESVCSVGVLYMKLTSEGKK